ncbi:MAG: arginine--tRNA ligase [Albidovulum sp.]|nr:arginine--tRNA ligase [Albidovulum sp.]
MDIFSEIRNIVIENLSEIASSDSLIIDPSRISVERPRDPTHGEIATNAAILAAKSANRKPRELAEFVAEKLLSDDRIAAADVAGPGFINLKLKEEAWLSVIPAILKSGAEFGRSTIGRNRRVCVEFVSANPTGPLHVGHARGAIFGDALSRLLEFVGFRVTREYYVNDGGAQVDSLARSVHLRYREANGFAVEFDANSYKGEYLGKLGRDLEAKYGEKFVDAPEHEWIGLFRGAAVGAMMELIRKDLESLGIEMDVYFSEKSLYGTGIIETTLNTLRERDLIYEGVLEQPKGKLIEDWEPRKQTLFRSTAHGDDVDRPICKSDGSWTYFAPDIAYHYDKIKRGFDELVNIFGSDHSGYTKRMKAAVAALSDGRVAFDIKLIQMVRVMEDGRAATMSKRAGEFVQLREAIEAVGCDVARFVMLTRKNDAPLDFDFAAVKEKSKDNPVFYVQYAHARICSVLRKAEQEGFDVSDTALASADLSTLRHPFESALVRRMAEWPRVVESAANSHEPHRIAYFLQNLASDLHGLWAQGNATASLRLLQRGEIATSTAKLALVRSAAIVFSCGLGILGVTPIQEMRS